MRIAPVVCLAAVMMGTLVPIGAAAELRLAEQVLERKLQDDPKWAPAMAALAMQEIMRECGELSRTAPSPRGEEFRKIAEGMIQPSNRPELTVYFVRGCREVAPKTIGAMIFVSARWLERADESDLWAAAAHEMAHRPRDFFLGVVVARYVKASASEKARLMEEVETRADEGALVLLRNAGENPKILSDFLEKENRVSFSPDIKRRVKALKAKILIASRD